MVETSYVSVVPSTLVSHIVIFFSLVSYHQLDSSRPHFRLFMIKLINCPPRPLFNSNSDLPYRTLKMKLTEAVTLLVSFCEPGHTGHHLQMVASSLYSVNVTSATGNIKLGDGTSIQLVLSHELVLSMTPKVLVLTMWTTFSCFQVCESPPGVPFPTPGCAHEYGSGS